jgi:uncharacterized RDD family membrane protein YckC
MICSNCGDVCDCPMEAPPTQSPILDSTIVAETAVLPGEAENGADSEAWRNELSERLTRYRSRRKAQPPRYPSLQLPLGPAIPALKTPFLEHSTSSGSSTCRASEPYTENGPSEAQPQTSPPAPRSNAHVPQAGAKIIEFPRFAWGPPPPPPDQLAGPVVDRPRILEVQEVAPPPPALGGITIEAARVSEPERRPGVDVPLQSASLGRRLAATLIDGIIIVTASVVFGLIFWKIALVRPPHIQLLALAAGIPCLFWAAYQYLLIVYAGTTPGVHLAGLQLSRFDGSPTKRSLRRWRVLASYLSAVSLGMGYAWLFLDEDGLCWHDRITRTYFAPRKQNSKAEDV